VNIEYQASYQYQAMWAYFDRDDVGLPHIAEHFKKMAKEELGHAQEFQSYTTKRGGQVRLLEMAPPEHEFAATKDKSDAQVAFEKALELEKNVYQQLLLLHKTAGLQNDPNMEDTVEGYLEEQVSSIKSFATHVSQLDRIGTSGTGVYMFDHNFE
jgi:ferritin heavy chain